MHEAFSHNHLLEVHYTSLKSHYFNYHQSTGLRGTIKPNPDYSRLSALDYSVLLVTTKSSCLFIYKICFILAANRMRLKCARAAVKWHDKKGPSSVTPAASSMMHSIARSDWHNCSMMYSIALHGDRSTFRRLFCTSRRCVFPFTSSFSQTHHIVPTVELQWWACIGLCKVASICMQLPLQGWFENTQDITSAVGNNAKT